MDEAARRDAIAARLGALALLLGGLGMLGVWASRRIFGDGWLPSWPEIFSWAAAGAGLLVGVAALAAFAWARMAAP